MPTGRPAISLSALLISHHRPTIINYGWANYTYNNGATHNLVLNNFAYENTANTAILAGAVPEPSSLLLLAAGGAGTLLAKRRRKAKQAVETVS